MAQVCSSEHSTLLEHPAHELLAEVHIGFILQHGRIAAHGHGASDGCSAIVTGLVTCHQSQLLTANVRHFRCLTLLDQATDSA